MEDVTEIEYRSTTIIEVLLSQIEIDDCLNKGIQRTKLNEEELGWTYRHHGKRSERAHAIGFMGEKAFEKWLKLENITYIENDSFVRKYNEIKQDFQISNYSIGVKSADSYSLENGTKYNSFLYPAKKEIGESKRVLDYPDYLIQTVVSVDKRICWLYGFVSKETIMDSPTRLIHNKPAHSIPIISYKPLTGFRQALGL